MVDVVHVEIETIDFQVERLGYAVVKIKYEGMERNYLSYRPVM
jgi:hypothetical protein